VNPLDRSSLVATLGPTNTGKTHRALLRMREHQTGMIGVPLRLLARELYDRLSSEIGESRVALITGEEKRVPPDPQYWICTVEAMPLDLKVDFLAIDEIQLCTHRERGHVFTERLLHARGRLETWFLGSATMTGLIRKLVPRAEVQSFPRLSELRSAGSYTLGSLGRRSAIVCFSAARVYEMAERLRARRGGAAIVLGALSPRARNAQVALYESGEVDYLVATDAIGMGLNLDLERVAFADTHKFDGQERRSLDVSELSQIAGRAGRYQKNGEFGVLAPEPQLPLAVERAIENHQLHGERGLIWRNHVLDFSSTETLLASLEVKPPRPELTLVRAADDSATLRHLLRRPDVRARVTSAEQVELLWETCRIPDYRKLLLEGHSNLVGEIFVELSDHGVLSAEFLEPRVRRLERGEGDIETLMNRIAYTRTWTYVTLRDGWVVGAERWRERTRALEDQLSDALHQALMARFVDKRKKVQDRPAPQETAKRADPFAALADLKRRLEGAPAEPRLSARERASEALHEELTLGEDLKIRFDGEELARLVPGKRLSEPELRLLASEEGAGLERRLERRLRAFVRDFVSETWGTASPSARSASEPSSALRGLFYQLEEGLGTVLAEATAPLVETLGESERRTLEGLGLVFGRHASYVRALLKPKALERRLLLWRAHTGERALGAWKSPTHPSFPIAERSPPPELLALGFVALGPRAVRVDVVEKMLAVPRDSPSRETEAQGTWIQRIGALSGATKRDAVRIGRALGRLDAAL